LELGKRIRSKSEELKMPQQQLAEQIYVTRQTISKLELEKSVSDAISKKGLERVLGIQFTEESSSKKEKEEDFLKKVHGSLA